MIDCPGRALHQMIQAEETIVAFTNVECFVFRTASIRATMQRATWMVLGPFADVAKGAFRADLPCFSAGIFGKGTASLDSTSKPVGIYGREQTCQEN